MARLDSKEGSIATLELRNDSIEFGLNQVTAPAMACDAFVRFAAAHGVRSIELRNDLGRQLFDGAPGADTKILCESLGVQISALAEVYGFNALSADIEQQTINLAKAARSVGAEAIVLIPRKGGQAVSFDELCTSLDRLGDLLVNEGIRGLIEPLGYSDSTLREFAVARRAIDQTHGPARFGIVHDTFHHALAGGGDVSSEYVSLIHVSGVTRKAQRHELQDADRGLPDASDTLGTIEQIAALRAGGCTAPVSFECFAPSVQQDAKLGLKLKKSMNFVAENVLQQAVSGDAALFQGSGMENA